jgi:hypothetical protein
VDLPESTLSIENYSTLMIRRNVPGGNAFNPLETAMNRIADLLDRDFSEPVEEKVKVNNNSPETVFAELTEYIATDRIRAEYESLFSAMAAAAKSPGDSVGVWISGFFGSGRSSFVKNLGYVLANRHVSGVSISSLFLKRMESAQLTESVEFLNRAVPCEIFPLDVRAELPLESSSEPIAEVMYRALLRDLDYAEDPDLSALEMELEKEGRLAAFQDLCRAENSEEWRKIRKGNQRLARSSALLHRFDPRTYTSTDTWLNTVHARTPRRLSVRESVEKMFALCEVRRRGKTLAFILDEMDQYAGAGARSLDDLREVVEQFGRESRERLKAGKIPGSAWIVVASRENLQQIHKRLAHDGLQDRFKLRIDLSSAGIGEVAARRVLRKKADGEAVLRALFRDRGASLMQNVSLERSSRRTEFDEDQFVRFYPYLPHFIDLSVAIVNGIVRHPDALDLDGSSRSLIKQSFEMLVSKRTRLAAQSIGVLVSIDKIYELVEWNLPAEKTKCVLDIGRRFDNHEDYPGMAARVAKAICLMEFAGTDLPRTTKNIAALLVQHVTEAPPALAVASILYLMKEARFVREADDGWKLYDLDELRRAVTALEGYGKAVGAVNPRHPGWHNDLIQLVKKSLARLLAWHTRPVRDFSASVSRSLEEVVRALDHLSTNTVTNDTLSTQLVALDHLSTDVAALEGRLTQSVQKQLDLLQEQVSLLLSLQKNATLETGWDRLVIDARPRENSRSVTGNGHANDRTAYVIGLFGTGRRYINELMLGNIGERAKYFRDTIRLHPGPTSMIYSGHATIRYDSRLQYSPAVTSRILEAAGAGFADLIFVYRHPLDSLLTNWIWWRNYIRDNKAISGISQIYESTDDLSADLEQKFSEFEAFAAGDPDFFAGVPGPRFLSFQEFVEETELHVESATLALRLEDFMIDPSKEFSRIVEVMSVDLDLTRSRLAPPRTRPYGYRAVQNKVPRFRGFIDGLGEETKRRIEKIGYNLGA